MRSAKFKKGDLVIVDDNGKPARYEIVSFLAPTRKSAEPIEFVYAARNMASGAQRTVSEDEILRLATPVDESSDLF